MTKKRIAHELASYGRNGDSMLVHMSPREYEALNTGLGSLTGSGTTINPETGLPEMFKWSSLIPAVVGIGASVLSGGTLSPLAAGMISGATTTAVTGDWRQGLTAGILGGAASGLGAGASEMMGSAGGAAAGAGMDAGMQMGSQMGSQAMTSAVADPMAGLAMEAGANGVSQAALDATAGAATQGLMDTGMQEGLGALGTGMGAEAAGGAATSGLGGTTGASFQDAFMGDKFMGRTVPGLMAVGHSVMGGIEPEEFEPEDTGSAPTTYKQMHRTYTPGGTDYTVKGGEPRMFSDPIYTEHKFAEGGLASLNGDQDMVSTKRARQLRGRYRSKKAVIDDLNRPNSYAKELGVTGPDDPILSVAFGFTAKQGKKNRSLSPAFAGGGHVEGAGDGMSDDIMTTIEGEQPAALSNDEFVVPADAVADLGNGSSQAGAQELEGMIARIRKMRHGTTEQPPAVDPRKAMPA